MLKPFVAYFEKRLHSRILAIFAAYLLAVLPFLGLMTFFYYQARKIFSELPDSRDKLEAAAIRMMDQFDALFNLNPNTSSDWVSENISTVLDTPFALIQEGFQSGTVILANTVLIVLITYFLLLYRSSLKSFLLTQVHPEYRETTEMILEQVQKLAKRYLVGQGIVVTLLGILIGSGLWIIGVPYPYFWGFVAGFLEIIPYVGTTVGVILPFSYMLMVSDTLWQPWAVVFLYILIQQIEGNLISPNIMGASIRINPLFIILGLFFGGMLWGIPGMILALPVLALTKEVFRGIDVLAPVSYILEDKLSKKAGLFPARFSAPKFRFLRLFVVREQDSTEKG